MKTFNTTGACFPDVHYMADVSEKLEKISRLVANGSYFVMNRPRQYGKTTILGLLAERLKDSYVVIPLDFQGLSEAKFQSEYVFAAAFANLMLRTVRNKKAPVNGLSESVLSKLQSGAAGSGDAFGLVELFEVLSELCDTAGKPVVLMIDEVDSASNNQIFLDFLAQLRNYYLKRYTVATFQSVILAGVYDIKNLKLKIRPEEEHRFNSPWNIAEVFSVDMSFSPGEIAGMLEEYEQDHHTGMNVSQMAQEIYDYTSGYPFLVSSVCKIIDRQFSDGQAAWSPEDIGKAVNVILSERTPLFDSMTRQLNEYPELRDILYRILFQGQRITFNPDQEAIRLGEMFGYVKNKNSVVAVSNRIFEMRLYNLFLSEEELTSVTYQDAQRMQNRFVQGGPF